MFIRLRRHTTLIPRKTKQQSSNNSLTKLAVINHKQLPLKLVKSQKIESVGLTPRILKIEQQVLNNVYSIRKQLKTKYLLCPMKRPEPVRLLRPLSNKLKTLNTISMPSAYEKLSGKYSTQMKNIKLVQRLLLLKPSKEISKSQLKIFYNQHKKYRNNIKQKKKSSSMLCDKKRSSFSIRL